jgi:hypothetical protein
VQIHSLKGKIMSLEATETVGTELQAPVEITEPTPSLTADDIFPTEPLPVPPAIPDAHRAVINAVELRHYDNGKGTVALVIHLQSQDIPTLQAEFPIFLPKLFVENIKVDPNSLPDQPENKQRSVYRMHIASEDGRATLQKLRKLAKDAHRSVESVGITAPSTNIDEFAENHSKLLSGLECVFYRATEKSAENTEYAHRLRVKGILSVEEAMKVPKFLRSYKRMWEPEA